MEALQSTNNPQSNGPINVSSLSICLPRIFQTLAAPVCNVGAEPRRLNGTVATLAAFSGARRAAALAARGAGAKRSFGSEVWELRSCHMQHGTGMATGMALGLVEVLDDVCNLWLELDEAYRSKEEALKAPQI